MLLAVFLKTGVYDRKDPNIVWLIADTVKRNIYTQKKFQECLITFGAMCNLSKLSKIENKRLSDIFSKIARKSLEILFIKFIKIKILIGFNHSLQMTEKSPTILSGGARGVVVIVVGNEHGDSSSNPGRD